MMAYRVFAIAGLVVLSASVSMAAEKDAPKLFPEERRKDPYAKLFTEATIAAQRRPPVPQDQVGRTEKPKVVCGMVMIHADAGVDPHMRKSPPEGDDVKYTIRAVKPPMCWER